MHKQYLPNRQKPLQDIMRENNNIAGTKLQVHKTRKQKVICQHTTSRMATLKPESQLFIPCGDPRTKVVFITRAWKTISQIRWKVHQTQRVVDVIVYILPCTWKPAALLEDRGPWSGQWYHYPNMPSLEPFVLSKITNQTVAKVSQTPSSRSLAFPSHR